MQGSSSRRTKNPHAHVHDASRSTPVAHGDSPSSARMHVLTTAPSIAAHGDSASRHGQSSAHSQHIHTHGRIRRGDQSPSAPSRPGPSSESISSVNKARPVIAIPGAATVTLHHSARALRAQIEIEIEIETQYQILPSHGGHSAMRARNPPHCWHALLIRPRPISCPWWACKSVHA